MKKEDYQSVYELWLGIEGFAIRDIDDSEKGIHKMIDRNPDISVVACDGDRIIGAILAGHDGRTGCMYHVCVHADYRKHGIGTHMSNMVLDAFRREEINQVSLIAFSDNNGGNAFWSDTGWKKRTDINSYNMLLNEKNVSRKVKNI